MADAVKNHGKIHVEALVGDKWIMRDAAPHKSTAAAEKWIRENAKENETYRIIREVRVMKTSVETVRKVRFE